MEHCNESCMYQYQSSYFDVLPMRKQFLVNYHYTRSRLSCKQMQMKLLVINGCSFLPNFFNTDVNNCDAKESARCNRVLDVTEFLANGTRCNVLTGRKSVASIKLPLNFISGIKYAPCYTCSVSTTVTPM